MRKSVLIIIVFHNERSLEDTLESIRSVREIDYKDYDIIVVNNGMRDGVRGKIISEFPGVHYLEAERNLGFAGGNNLGIDYGMSNGYDFFLILNNDVAVAPDFLTRLVSRINQDETIGMVGPKTFYFAQKDKVWAAGGYIIKWRALIGGLHEDNERVEDFLGRWLRGLRELIGKGEKTTYTEGEVDYLPGSCILVKSDVIEKVGKLPEEYLFAFEEAEIALKVKRAGYKVVVEPKAHIWHKVGLSSEQVPEMIYNTYRDRLIFLKRNFRFPFNLFLIVILVISELILRAAVRKFMIEALFDHMKYRRVEEEHILRIKRKYKS